MTLKLTVISNISEKYSGINDFRKGYQLRTNIVMEENLDLVTDSPRIFPRWRNHSSQLECTWISLS